MSDSQADISHMKQSGVRSWFHEKAYSTWLSFGLSRRLKHRRVKIIQECAGFNLNQLKNDGTKCLICEIGCGSGKDFIRFLSESPNKIWGVDPIDCSIEQKNFSYIQADAITLPFGDRFFDVVVSIGVLEHVEPIEHLCAVISEIVRVSKNYVIIVPSINTILEPHTQIFRWQLKSVKKLDALNYFSDMSWLKFAGFSGAKTRRFDYFPGLITNLVIYGSNPIKSDLEP